MGRPVLVGMGDAQVSAVLSLVAVVMLDTHGGAQRDRGGRGGYEVAGVLSAQAHWLHLCVAVHVVSM